MGSVPKDDNFLKPSLGIVAFAFVTSLFASLVGSELLVFFLVWLPALVYLFVKQPTHIIARVLLLLGLVLEGPEERAGNGYWEPPFAPISKVVLGGLNKWLGLPGASIPLYLVLCLILLFMARKAHRSRSERPTVESRKAVHVHLIGIGVAMVWGLLRGGQIQPMVWQVLYPISVAFITLAMLWSVRGKQDLRAIGTIIIVVALTKAAQVAWVYFVICSPLNVKPFYATTHSDSVNFAAAFAVLVTRAFEDRSKAAIRVLAILTPILLITVYMNNRRLAFLAMGISLLIAGIFLKSKKIKRKLVIAAIVLSPFATAYLVIGASSSHPIFALAKAVSSVSSSSDSSSETRDIENYNLHVTLKRAMIAGIGFGNEYDEFVRAYDISKGHALYLYIPHNTVLWLVAVGGFLVFHLIWLPYAMLAYLAFRSYRLASSPVERAASLSCVCILVIFLLQAWGDMGITAYTPGVLFAVAYAVAARLDGAYRPPASGTPRRMAEVS